MVESLRRFPTGVEGLDAISCGGLIVGASYMIQGRPGSGKTILANQIAYHHAADGGRVLFVTLLSESHERLIQFISGLSFFDPARVGAGVTYVSAFETLSEDGLDGVIDLLRQEIQRQKATLLVVDGVLNARAKAETDLDTKRFIAELQAHAAFRDCTTLLLTSARLDDSSPEHTMVDGVLELGEEICGVRGVRRLHLRKSRGSAALNGLHQYEITGRGVVCHPRLESVLRRPSVESAPGADRVASGVADLDAMIGGGLPRGSLTLAIGPSGAGKTTLGLHFLAEASAAAPALHFGLYETPDRLKLKAAAVGLDLAALERDGRLELIWEPATENLLDALAHRLLAAVRARGVKRLFIDGLGAFERAAVYPGRLMEFFTALANELRALGVTTLATWEMRDLFGGTVSAPSPEISGVVDNLLLMRFAEQEAQVRRVFSVLKIRDSAFDGALREFQISDRGVALKAAFEGSTSVLAGSAQPAKT